MLRLVGVVGIQQAMQFLGALSIHRFVAALSEPATTTSKRGTIKGGGLIGLGVVFVLVGLMSYAIVGAMKAGKFGIPSRGSRAMKLVLSAFFVLLGAYLVVAGIATA